METANQKLLAPAITALTVLADKMPGIRIASVMDRVTLKTACIAKMRDTFRDADAITEVNHARYEDIAIRLFATVFEPLIKSHVDQVHERIETAFQDCLLYTSPSPRD